jgi:predicted Fe-Mo cluster-binding NifX family protein
MSKIKVAVPSVEPGGLKAKRSGHFGRCDVFTLVDIEDGQIKNTQVIENVEHREGGCLVPVRLLAVQGVNTIIVSGMGMGPLMGFREAGIEVLIGCGVTVEESINDFIAGKLESMSDEYVCSGH